ncbi:Interferon-induced Mx protein [Penicillium camemberti]|uniref:Interferon-induced Mx protein n=1 Tax=Penicillium camemberti (strain FM 013) TaxID=1429867 RepID=A0A0G4PP87_PENC3|nr:Interferon-induced Mx protein [Penicillium camemberti]
MSSSTEVDTALHQLQTEQGPLLDKIDDLRTIGVGGIVGLPQLIVCGNQSSGKSSVLEAVSRVRFPMKSNVCTRFPTEVILRRHPTPRFKVSIEPGSSRTSKGERQKIEAFKPAEVTNGNRLGSLIEKAKECMGITGDGFSDDILKVEISGPDKPELTLVDLPGLYTSHSTSQDEQGIDIVHKITEHYMENKRSIILAVVSAKNDYHNQRVLNMAEKFDGSRERTIGIITQPDILEAHSDEEASWLQILKNEKVPLKLGWHALRNRSFETRKVSDDERDRKEKEFFAQGNWGSIPAEYMGIDNFRRRLSSILLKHIQRNLPGLIVDIHEKVLDRQSRLSKLGPPRGTLQQQKGFLLNISSNFERITAQALDGMYTDDFFGGLDNEIGPFDQDPRRLRAVIRELNEYFADAMNNIGCGQLIGPFNASMVPVIGNPYTHIRAPEIRRRSDIEHEVSIQARQNRGIELPGSANQLLVGKLFREQSKPWEEIAREHLTKSWDSVRDFISLLLQHLANDHTYNLILGNILDPELEKMKDHLLAKLDELTAYNKRGHPLPLGKSFLTKIQKARSDRQIDRLEQALKLGSHSGDESTTIQRLREANSQLDSTSNQFAAADIVDQMQAYYDTALITFIDNVATLGIENCLLGPLSSILTSQTVNNMEDKQVQDIAAEPSYIVDERDRLTRELAKLQAGSRTLSKFNIRKVTAKPAAVNPTTQTKSSRKNITPSATSSVWASQPTHTSPGPNPFASGPSGTPSPMAGSTTTKSTGTMRNSFGNLQGPQPVIGGTQSLFPEPRGGRFGSNYGSGSGFGSFSSSGSLFQGEATSSPFGSSAFGSTTAPNTDAASSGSSNRPPSQPNPFLPLPSGNSQSKAESTVPFAKLSNSSRR